MLDKSLIDSIKAISDSISFDEESQIFNLEKVDEWLEISTKIKELGLDYLMCITSIDLEDGNLSLAYNLNSTASQASIEFNLIFNEGTEVPSIESIWKTADWHEREAYDMMGIKFSGHPEMKRILLPQDWEGHPLKKDYEVADYYHGIYIPKDKTSWE
jgi:NADH-quinone oxidoreductase subunit C